MLPQVERLSPFARWWAPLILVALVFGAFAPALGAGFVDFDDPRVVVQNPHLRGLAREHVSWMWRTSHMGHFQPLTWMSLGLDYELFGLEAPGYHRTNVALHALGAVLFYFLARRLLALAAPTTSGLTLGAWAAAALFALHPLRVESVAWITERRDVLSGVFFTATLLCWLRWARPAVALPAERPRVAPAVAAAGLAAAALAALAFALDLDQPALTLGAFGPLAPWGPLFALALLAASVACAIRIAPTPDRSRGVWYALACASLFASLLCKAWGIVMPALLLLLDAWPLSRVRGARAWARLLAEKAPILALSLAAMRLAAWAQASEGAARTWAEHGVGERLAQGFYGLAFYPWKTLVPTGLSVMHELPNTLSLAEPRFLLPAVLVSAVTLALFALRRRFPAALATWVAYVVIVSPVLGVAQSGPQLVAERYAYLAGMPLALACGGALRAAALREWQRVAAALLALAVPALVFATFQRSRAWHSSETLWEAAYAVAPESPVTLLALGKLRTDQAAASTDAAQRAVLLREARQLFLAGLDGEANPRFLGNLSGVHSQLAQLEPERREEHLLEALEFSRRALELAAGLPDPPVEYRLTYGVNLLYLGRVAEALPHLEACVARRPRAVRAMLHLARAYGLADRHADAAALLARAVELDPNDADAWSQLGLAQERSAQRAAAERSYRRALEISPAHPLASERLRALGVAH